MTHKRETAVVACANLGLVGVDIDLGMASRTTSAVAGNYAVVSPTYGLLVNELNGRIRLGL